MYPIISLISPLAQGKVRFYQGGNLSKMEIMFLWYTSHSESHCLDSSEYLWKSGLTEPRLCKKKGFPKGLQRNDGDDDGD